MPCAAPVDATSASAAAPSTRALILGGRLRRVEGRLGVGGCTCVTAHHELVEAPARRAVALNRVMIMRAVNLYVIHAACAL